MAEHTGVHPDYAACGAAQQAARHRGCLPRLAFRAVPTSIMAASGFTASSVANAASTAARCCPRGFGAFRRLTNRKPKSTPAIV
jgi:hypothetical protein